MGESNPGRRAAASGAGHRMGNGMAGWMASGHRTDNAAMTWS